MVKVAPSYTDKQVLLATVDAYVNSDLKKYLSNGSYPTVRVFHKGKVTKSTFLGNKNETFVRNFIDTVVQDSAPRKALSLQELQTTAEFEKLIANAQVPVIVKFSAHW